MQKALLLTSSFVEQDSVSNITKNIIYAFKQVPHIKTTIHIIENTLIQSLKISEFNFIVIVHPIVLLTSELKDIIQAVTPKETVIIFFVFGDIVRKSGQLIALEKSLTGMKVHFIVASQCYKQLLSKSLNDPKEISIVPFPVDKKLFYFSNSDRDSFRKKNKLTLKDKVLIYTGRISSQKNIIFLLESYASAKLKHPNLKLFIYGNIDEFESPTFYEKKNEPGNYFNQLRKKLCDIDSKDVTFFPRIHGNKLKEAYNGCDLFVSMSLYHDEDFGYSPIEALCCGTPALLTAWGGYHDFKNKKLNEKSIALVKVNYTKNSLIINDKEAETSLIKSIATSKRSQLASKRYQRFYSIETNTERYSLILNRKFGPFSGFSKDFIKLSLSMYFKQSVDLRLYRKFYQAFWSK